MKTILLILLSIITIAARAEGITISAGISQFQHQPDNTWYDEVWDHDLGLRSQSMAIDYETPVYRDWSLDLGAIYVGHINSTAKIYADDVTYAKYHGCAPSGCTIDTTWRGSGNVAALTVGIRTPEWHRLSATVGAAATYTDWRMHVTGAGPMDFKNTHRWQVHPFYALQYAFMPHWSVRLSQYEAQDKGDGSVDYGTGSRTDTYTPSIVQGKAYNLSLGYAF